MLLIWNILLYIDIYLLNNVSPKQTVTYGKEMPKIDGGRPWDQIRGAHRWLCPLANLDTKNYGYTWYVET